MRADTWANAIARSDKSSGRRRVGYERSWLIRSHNILCLIRSHNIMSAEAGMRKQLRDVVRCLTTANPISTPAGRPCRVITISSRAARRRYLERPSFICASATAWTRGTFFLESQISDGKQGTLHGADMAAVEWLPA